MCIYSSYSRLNSQVRLSRYFYEQIKQNGCTASLEVKTIMNEFYLLNVAVNNLPKFQNIVDLVYKKPALTAILKQIWDITQHVHIFHF